MRKISFHLGVLTVLLAGFPARAGQTDNAPQQQLLLPSQSSVYNQHGLTLPSAPTVHGSDVVRGAGGISCQSSVSNGGAYLDAGLINSEDMFDRGATAAYGRVVIPLGRKAARLDCNKLYELEIRRLEMELEIMRMSGAAMASSANLLQLRQQQQPAPAPDTGARAENMSARTAKREKDRPEMTFRVLDKDPIVVPTAAEPAASDDNGAPPALQMDACNCDGDLFADNRGLR